MSNAKRIISFGRYRALSHIFPFRLATPEEVSEMIDTCMKDAAESSQNIRNLMNLYLKNNPQHHETLYPFFIEVANEQEKYLKDQKLMLESVTSNSSVHYPVIYGDYMFSHGISDNCYEYATRDYYESRLLGWSGMNVFKEMEMFTISDQQRGSLPMFLNPGFSYEWPLYKQSPSSWEEKYGDLLQSVDGITQAMQHDAAQYGLTFTRAHFTPGATVQRGHTLIFCILGLSGTPDTPSIDYHFYRYHPEYGYWSHKPGSTPVTCFDANDHLIVDPSQCKHSYNLGTVDVGFFDINIT